MLLRTPLDLGVVIRDHRRHLNLDQDALARQVGVSRKWIVEVEKGKPRAEIGLILRTLEALGLRLSLDDPRTPDSGDTGPAVTAPDLDSVLSRTQDRRS